MASRSPHGISPVAQADLTDGPLLGTSLSPNAGLFLQLLLLPSPPAGTASQKVSSESGLISAQLSSTGNSTSDLHVADQSHMADKMMASQHADLVIFFFLFANQGNQKYAWLTKFVINKIKELYTRGNKNDGSTNTCSLKFYLKGQFCFVLFCLSGVLQNEAKKQELIDS